MRLPDRGHPACKVPWQQRDRCLSDVDCKTGYLCAKRGQMIGRCTYLDCCDPWRQGPRLMQGEDWCTHRYEEKIK